MWAEKGVTHLTREDLKRFSLIFELFLKRENGKPVLNE